MKDLSDSHYCELHENLLAFHEVKVEQNPVVSPYPTMLFRGHMLRS